eukprot:854416-Pleurochrysis_carterae.AAC.4
MSSRDWHSPSDLLLFVSSPWASWIERTTQASSQPHCLHFCNHSCPNGQPFPDAYAHFISPRLNSLPPPCRALSVLKSVPSTTWLDPCFAGTFEQGGDGGARARVAQPRRRR